MEMVALGIHRILQDVEILMIQTSQLLKIAVLVAVELKMILMVTVIVKIITLFLFLNQASYQLIPSIGVCFGYGLVF